MKSAGIRIFVLTAVVGFFAANAYAQFYRDWYVPHLAFGGGYTSTLTVRDLQGTASRSLQVWFFDNNGNDLTGNVSGVGNVHYFTFTLAANQEKSFAITSTSSSIFQGSIVIEAADTGNLSVANRFTFKEASGEIKDVVGILAASPNFNWSLSVEKGTSADFTGVAIQNPYDGQLSVNVEFYQNGARVPGTVTRQFTLPGYGHLAKFWHESDMFGSAWDTFSGVGTLRISTTGNNFAAVGLRGDNIQYSSLPADIGVQQWSVTYTHGLTPITGTWIWQFIEGYSFFGYEQSNLSSKKFAFRGVMATDVLGFHAESNWINNADGTKGMWIFQAVLSSANPTTITGKRIDLKSDGTILSTNNFTATRTN